MEDRLQQDALGESEAFLDFMGKLSRVARVDRSVLIIGERGSGKEIAASRLHYLSKRWEGPFVTLNCAALTPSLIESELFGHEAGAYTGASGRRKGRFEEAHGGTLFLDEIGLIPQEVQEKILRVVEYGQFERVGSSKPVEVDVRIVGATNADLKMLSDQGKFKKDLLDRLSFEVLFLPPLRYRESDINLLVHYFSNKMALELGVKETVSFTDDIWKIFTDYDWPGNVRELKNVVERAVYSSEKFPINSVKINPFENPFMKREEKKENKSLPDLSNFKTSMREYEMNFLIRSLEDAKYNQREAAKLLNLSYDQFRGLYRKYKDEIE